MVFLARVQTGMVNSRGAALGAAEVSQMGAAALSELFAAPIVEGREHIKGERYPGQRAQFQVRPISASV
jgi:hypothetical protein